jgi:hypothetical protein
MPFAGLNINGIDVAELTSLLRFHFGMSQNAPNQKIVFLRGEPRLSLTFDKMWNVSSITRHNGLDDQEVADINDKIDRQLRQSDGIYVFRDFLFYTVAVEHAHRHSDIFQFFPVPQGSAKPDTLLAPHPFVVEVSVPSGSNPFINADRGKLKAKHIKNVLALLLQFHVKGCPTSTQHVWVFDNPAGSPPVNLRQVMYTCIDPAWRPDQLTDISSFPSPNRPSPTEYYAKHGISGNEGLELPSNFDDQFQRYFALQGESGRRFQRACYWYAHAYDVRPLSKSASYVALVTAIESMLDAAPDGKPCGTCGKVPTDGPTKQFRSFIETYVPGADEIKIVKSELYGIRSRMAHGSRVMSNDVGGWDDPRHADEDAMHRQLTRLVQFALVNWLASRT